MTSLTYDFDGIAVRFHFRTELPERTSHLLEFAVQLVYEERQECAASALEEPTCPHLFRPLRLGCTPHSGRTGRGPRT